MRFFKMKYNFQRNHYVCVFKDAVSYEVLLRVSWTLLFCNYSINYSLVSPPTPFDNRFFLIVLSKLRHVKWAVFYVKNKDLPFCLSLVWNVFHDTVERTQVKTKKQPKNPDVLLRRQSKWAPYFLGMINLTEYVKRNYRLHWKALYL